MFTARLIAVSRCQNTNRMIVTFIAVERTVTYARNDYGFPVPMVTTRVAAFPFVMGN